MGRVENEENSVEIGWTTTELVRKTMENEAIDVKETLAIQLRILILAICQAAWWKMGGAKT